MDELLDKTRAFFLRRVVAELKRPIDWRAQGRGKGIVRRTGIYLAAFLRDIVRIPLHHPDGIGQARFRARVQYIADDAIPIIEFFQAEYACDMRVGALLDEAIEWLGKGKQLVEDGPFPRLDLWYATMDEFSQLTEYSRQAAEKIEDAIGAEPARAGNVNL
jgi:hypothetical protein